MKGNYMTTVNQLIEALQAIENKELPIELVINIYDKRYPVYGRIISNGWDKIVYDSPLGNTIRVNCELEAPVGNTDSYYTIREMKKK
jgi:hypothetical protein